MAKKRMFSLGVLDTDAFLDMPLSAQALYFHLNLRADDDGFIGSPKRITQNIGANIDDLKLLIAKRFVIAFEDGVIVIKHWRMHNAIKKDRYTETNYTEDLEMLDIKSNGAYTLRSTDGAQLEHKRSTDGEQMAQTCSVDKIRLDKISKDKYREDNTMAENGPSSGKPDGSVKVLDPVESWFTLFWKEYPRKVKKPDAFKAFKQKCRKSEDFDLIMNGLQKWTKAWKDPQFIPYPATWIRNEQYNDEPPRTKEERLLF